VNSEVVIIDFTRTPLVKPGTSFANLTSQDLAAACIADLIKRTGLPKEKVEDVVFGQSIITTFPYNLARYSAVLSGLPLEVPGYTVQCLEASGLQALQNAYYLTATENCETVIAGGAESYSVAPYVIREARYSYDPEVNKVADTINEVKTYTQPEPINKAAQVRALVAEKGYTPERQQAMVERSFKKALAAKEQGVWENHLTPVIVKDRKKGELVYTKDMFLSTKEPAVTEYLGAANADGACAMLVMTANEAQRNNLVPMASIKGIACSACPPSDSWQAAILAVEKLLIKKKLTYKDIDLFEIREDSAAALLNMIETLSCKAEMDSSLMADRINTCGGSLALGSSAGADGMILVCSLILGLRNTGKKRGIAAASAAGGQGIAALIEMIDS